MVTSLAALESPKLTVTSLTDLIADMVDGGSGGGEMVTVFDSLHAPELKSLSALDLT